MALRSAPNSAGRKPSNRRRSNRQTSAVTEVRDRIDEEEIEIGSAQAQWISQDNTPTTTSSTGISAPHPLQLVTPRENYSQAVVHNTRGCYYRTFELAHFAIVK